MTLEVEGGVAGGVRKRGIWEGGGAKARVSLHLEVLAVLSSISLPINYGNLDTNTV